jgi:ATP-dependent DNA helicase RecG
MLGKRIEFKSVGDSYPTSNIGKYFSALANEANLRKKTMGLRLHMTQQLDNHQKKISPLQFNF